MVVHRSLFDIIARVETGAMLANLTQIPVCVIRISHLGRFNQIKMYRYFVSSNAVIYEVMLDVDKVSVPTF